jgi:hypothetical protein
MTETLSEKLSQSKFFEFIGYEEAQHEIIMSPERYVGAWQSVNDLRVQLGEHLFQEFLNYVKKRISGISEIETTYLTRSWFARKK